MVQAPLGELWEDTMGSSYEEGGAAAEDLIALGYHQVEILLLDNF